MNLKEKYRNNRILNHSTYFEVFESDAENFAEFLAILNRDTGIVGLDMKNFKSSISGCDTVYFRSHTGSNLLKITDELCEILAPGSKAICIITAKKLPIDINSQEGYSFGKCVKQIKDTIYPDDFLWNIYETDQQEKYKIYVLYGD